MSLTLASTERLLAQTAAEHVALGDRDYAERKAPDARQHFLQALAIEAKNYEALWKASRVETDLAESLPNGPAHDSAMAHARRHAEDAIAVNPNDAEGHFSLARALGRKALAVGTMDRIRYSKVVRAEAFEALKYDSTHAGALHVLGMWHAEVMRVSGLARAFARTFLGARVFALASWDSAQALLERAVRYDDVRIVHRLDLGAIYADRGDKARARAQFLLIERAPIREYNDALYKRQAAERLRKL
ncbi:MAG TPA: hypothetical protein VJL28_12970 [Gemmatimonadaceae bacterium]|nr:hypothetical protein [Gemmatimonadaceae bacterium]